MVAEAIPPIFGAGKKIYDLAEERGWLDKLIKRLKGVEHVLVLGSTGAGKSQFLSSLHTELPEAIHEMARTEAAKTEEIKFDGQFFDLIDTPGEKAKLAKRQDAYREFVSRDEPGGIINVVSNGFHEFSKGRDLSPLTAQGQPSKKYLAEHRRVEIEALSEWLPTVASPDSVAWMITVVTKADLWWGDRASVEAHYAEGPYAEALASLGWLSPSVVSYSSLRHKFYGTGRIDGSFDDHDLALSRERLLRTLIELSSRAK